MTTVFEELNVAVRKKITDRLASDSTILWEGETTLGEEFVERYALVTDVNQQNFTVMRSWASIGHEPLLCVDLDLSHSQFFGAVDEETFPHQPTSADGVADAMRDALPNQHTVVLWHADGGGSDLRHPFIARTAKVGQEEQLIAGCLLIEPLNVEVEFVSDISDLEPKGRGFRM